MASALENFVNTIRNQSGKPREILEACKMSKEVLAKNTNYLDNVLETLDTQQHTIGVMFVLAAKFTALTGTPADTELITKLVRDFVQTSNQDQVRFASGNFVELLHLYANYLIQNNVSGIVGIPVLCEAINKLQTADNQLTGIHADLFMLCLAAKIFKPALAHLDADVTSIATTDDSAQDAKYFLLYYYYGGMIYTALKNYDRGLYFFEVAISTPALAMSHIMLEAYKKFVLVSLILHGSVQSKYLQGPTKCIKALSGEYQELAQAYKKGESEAIRTLMQRYRDKFTRDTNMGLVKQVAATLVKKNIQRLTRTFLTLSLADVASRVQLAGGAAEAEVYLLNMIKSREIFATINQKDGMVVFKDDPEKYDSPEMFVAVQAEMARVMSLHEQIRKMDEDITLNMMYVKKSTGYQDEELINVGSSKTFETEANE